MNRIILIGGSPAAGKTYAAKKLGEELKLPWISTDQIREQMRWMVSKEDYPDLFNDFDGGPDEALKLYTNNTLEQIIEIQIKENKDVWKGIRGFVEGDYVWGDFIVEGVAVTPELVHLQKWKNKKNINAVFIIDEDVERVRKTIFTRGLWDEAHKYSDEVKEKEVEWVLAFNDYIRNHADKYHFPIISVDRDNYIEKIRELIS